MTPVVLPPSPSPSPSPPLPSPLPPHTHTLTQHDFVGGYNDVKLEGVRDDPSSRITVVQFIFVNETTTVRTGGDKTHHIK